MVDQDPTHEALVPYDELDPATAAQDLPYLRAILASTTG